MKRGRNPRTVKPSGVVLLLLSYCWENFTDLELIQGWPDEADHRITRITRRCDYRSKPVTRNRTSYLLQSNLKKERE